MKDKYTALWVSHTSINDFLLCPRAYYFKHVYRDKKTGHKIKLMSPPLALGQAVHEVLESLSILPTDERFTVSLIDKFDTVWQKVAGIRGGFTNPESEEIYKRRGKEMLEYVTINPGPLKNLAVKINMDLPHFYLSDQDNIILCGKIDWLEYLPESDSVHIIDFKTSQQKEDGSSLQLPIYYLLASTCQTHPVVKASYWYLIGSADPEEKQLPEKDAATKQILTIAKQIKLARSLERFKCPHQTGCSYCKPLERITQGYGQLVGQDEYHNDVFILERETAAAQDSSII